MCILCELFQHLKEDSGFLLYWLDECRTVLLLLVIALLAIYCTHLLPPTHTHGRHSYNIHNYTWHSAEAIDKDKIPIECNESTNNVLCLSPKKTLCS